MDRIIDWLVDWFDWLIDWNEAKITLEKNLGEPTKFFDRISILFNSKGSIKFDDLNKSTVIYDEWSKVFSRTSRRKLQMGKKLTM